MAAALGLCVGGCDRLGDAISGYPARDCHPDPKTVAALHQEPVLTQAPPGATLSAATETVSCGWEESKPPNLGMLDVEVTGAGAADEVSRFYEDLARSSGWKTFGQGSLVFQDMAGRHHVYDASKPDGTNCTWGLQVLSTAEGVYHVQITYTPRDLRPTCL